MTDAMMSLNAWFQKTSDADMLRKMIGFAAEVAAGERPVTAAMREAGTGLKSA
jgi:hypothetical protein